MGSRDRPVHYDSEKISVFLAIYIFGIENHTYRIISLRYNFTMLDITEDTIRMLLFEDQCRKRLIPY